MSYKKLANKVFIQTLERLPLAEEKNERANNEGIIGSISDFVALMTSTIEASKEAYNIEDTDALIPLEQYPRDLIWKINNGKEEITETSKKQITIVTYSADELPAQISAHSAYSTSGIRNIKPRLIDSLPDPKYEGYSVARIGKEIEASFEFLVWGMEDKGIRERALLLRKIIRDNVWFLKHKGLKEIVWLGSSEKDVWDKQNIVKYKRESYKIVFTEIQEIREKNIEQILVHIGPEWHLNDGG